jgi:hypothetical protein
VEDRPNSYLVAGERVGVKERGRERGAPLIGAVLVVASARRHAGGVLNET